MSNQEISSVSIHNDIWYCFIFNFMALGDIHPSKSDICKRCKHFFKESYTLLCILARIL